MGKKGKNKMEEQIIRIEDYSKLKGVHKKIIQILNAHNVSCYNAIGILETIKQEIFIENTEEDMDD
jgi:hypothetical protein